MARETKAFRIAWEKTFLIQPTLLNLKSNTDDDKFRIHMSIISDWSYIYPLFCNTLKTIKMRSFENFKLFTEY